MAMAVGPLLVDQAITSRSVPVTSTFCPKPAPETATPIGDPSDRCNAAKLVLSAGDRMVLAFGAAFWMAGVPMT